jgi:hypothetical protein
MVKVREARRAFHDFYASCFWSYDPNYRITLQDVPWVANVGTKKEAEARAVKPHHGGPGGVLPVFG